MGLGHCVKTWQEEATGTGVGAQEAALEERTQSFGAKLRAADNFPCPLRSRGGPVLLEGEASATKDWGAGGVRAGCVHS